MLKVSVIVPVYNGEKHLRECLDSIRNQTLTDIEIICVDDGSTDSSPEILQEYKNADARMQIIRQANKGAGAARNKGLDAATGKYLAFWDCDDYFALDALEKMFEKAEENQADICVCDACDFESDTGKTVAHSYLRSPLPETEVFNILSYKQRIFWFTSAVPWNKLILRELMLKEKIRFQEQMHINDVFAIYSAIAFARRIVLVKEKLIYYRVNQPGSLMSTYGECVDSVFEAYEQLKINLERHGDILDDPEILQGFRNKVLDIYIYIMRYCNTFSQYRYYYDSLRERRFQAVGLEGLEADYIFNPRHAERYKNIYQMEAEDYLLWQYQTLQFNDNMLRNDFNRQKSDLKTQKNKLKKQKSELKEQKSELDQQKKDLVKLEERTKSLETLTQSQERQLQLKSVRAALKLSRVPGKFCECFKGKRKQKV